MLKSVCAEYTVVEVLLLVSSGRDDALDGALEASLDETDGGSCNDSLRASRSFFEELAGGAGTEGRGNGVRSRGGRGGAVEEAGLSGSRTDMGGGGNGPAVECTPGS